MIYLYSFLFAGTVCLTAEIILQNTNLKPGHITSLFVVIGAFLDIFNIYDYFVDHFGAGASVCITSFGHLMIHGALSDVKSKGIIGLLTGMFNLTTSGIIATVIFSFLSCIIFKAKE